jgi:hypothetical protein
MAATALVAGLPLLTADRRDPWVQGGPDGLVRTSMRGTRPLTQVRANRLTADPRAFPCQFSSRIATSSGCSSTQFLYSSLLIFATLRLIGLCVWLCPKSTRVSKHEF